MFSRLFFFFILLLEFPSYSVGQNPDPLQEEFRIYEEKGKYWREMAQFDSSLHYYKKAAAEYENSLNSQVDLSTWENLLLCYAWIGENFCALELTDSALIYGFVVEKLSSQKLDPNNKALAQAYNVLGSSFLDLSDFGKAKIYHQKALEIRKAVFGQKHLEVSHSYENLGNVLSNEGKYDSALFLHHKALAMRSLESNRNNRFLAYSHINLGYSYSDLGQNKVAIGHYDQAERYLLDYFPPEHPNFGIIYNNLGVIYQDLGSYNKSLKYLQKARDIYLKAYGATSRQLIDWELNMGNLHFGKGDYVGAQRHWENALGGLLSFPQPPQRKLRAIYQNLSMALNKLGDKTTAENYQLRSLEIAKKIFPSNHPEIASNFTNLGLIARDRGKYSQAINFFLKALDIQLETLPYPHQDLGRTYSNLGMIEQMRGHMKEGMEYLKTSLEIFLSVQGELNDNVAIVYTNMGAIAVSEGNFELGRTYLSKSNKIYQQLFGDSHTGIASNLSNYAFILEEEGKRDSAYRYYQQALEIYKRVYSGPHYEIIKLQRQLAEIHWSKGYREKALLLLEEAYENMGFQQQEPFDFSYLLHEELALKILQSRIKILIGSLDDPLENLLEADSLLMIGFALLDEFRKKFSFEESELSLQNLVIPLFEFGINCQIDLYEITRESAYLKKAFYYAEKSKSYLLQRRLRLAKNIKFSGVPDTLLQLEGQLQLAFSHQHQRLRNALSSPSTDSLQEVIRKKLNIIEHQIDSLNFIFSKNYPEYYQLKYSDEVVDLDQLKTFLEKNPQSALLSFFMGYKWGVVFSITGDSVQYGKFPIPKSLIWEIQDFYRVLSSNPLISDEAYFIEGRRKYASLGSSLFKKLLPVGLPDEQAFPHLNIIADGILGYIPFEGLLSEVPQQPYSYKNFPYLMKRFNISYNYSATLWMKEQSKPKISSKKYGGFAPSYPGPRDLFLSTREEEIWNSPKKNFSRLQFNQPEVQRVSRLMDGVSYLGEEATETRFKEEVKDFDIVHLAMHGFFDESDPFQSGLVFSPKGDSTNDGFLYAHELYSMDLSLDLAVLSACHGGMGSLARGEGIMSLSRAFKYAGCPNIIGSQWQADDRSSQFILGDLFSHLSQDYPRSISLQEAKIAFLESASEVQAHPFYWAAWVLVGNSNEIAPYPRFNVIVFVALTLFLLLLFALIRWFKPFFT